MWWRRGEVRERHRQERSGGTREQERSRRRGE